MNPSKLLFNQGWLTTPGEMNSEDQNEYIQYEQNLEND
jgi:hypothetical protein